MRTQLVELAREMGVKADANGPAVDALLACPLYFYSEAPTERDSRFTEIATILEELVNVWPALEAMQRLLDRSVEGLPNVDAGTLWR